LRAVHQEERKKVSVVYDRSEADQRTYAPQGFFGMLASDLADADKHFVEVDLDDPFFRVLRIEAETPFDFAKIGLASAQVSIDYGDPADPATLKHADFVFDAAHPGPQVFETTLAPDLDSSYRHSVQYHFSPDSDWKGDRFSYELPPRRTEDRTLLLNPFEYLGFLEVEVLPHRIDAGLIDSTEVHLLPVGVPEDQETILRVAPNSPPQRWRFRLDQPGGSAFVHRFTHHLKDGQIRTTEPEISRASALPVDDPFPAAIEIDFMPLWDPAATRQVFVQIEYTDADANYERSERLTLAADKVDPIRFRLAIQNPALRTFKFRQTQITKDNKVRQTDWIETTDTLIGLPDLEV
jgi:hypothetical protein